MTARHGQGSRSIVLQAVDEACFHVIIPAKAGIQRKHQPHTERALSTGCSVFPIAQDFVEGFPQAIGINGLKEEIQGL